ncbi:hypothetical protein IMG5_100910 [Ichthyophthirius multifiliis]|uniref:Protein kinase domain-containing protein n=1 Tax=Ichthyophthirius multifiliis TaxID=5932 RepID=G0QSF9_ICHMU|nr:hypothetical protein IMG5_100910 [Ichthyophthirius multifiliis]EGR31838.1 hypothetical protein IMG5_100910 [Ichthyophthirius multifiliis]|eukprot:XP_004035324.1 hypothetical protein IMG5_100910 [Ichthyophthirius multifiliis]
MINFINNNYIYDKIKENQLENKQSLANTFQLKNFKELNDKKEILKNQIFKDQKQKKAIFEYVQNFQINKQQNQKNQKLNDYQTAFYEKLKQNTHEKIQQQYKQQQINNKQNQQQNNFINLNYEYLDQQYTLKQKQNHQNFSISQLEFIKYIGKGVFGGVYMVRNKVDQNIYALKVINKQIIKQNEMQDQFQREVLINKNYCKNKNIIQFIDYFQDEQNHFILLEYANDGNLAYFLKKNLKFDERISKKMVKQIALAIQFLHNQNIFHRDLKLENILIQNGVIKICDFGCANYSSKIFKKRSFCGTLEYLAPEIIQNQIYDKEIDIWALGIICFELNAGFTPFARNTESNTCQAIQKDMVLYPKHFSQNLIEFLESILKKNQYERICINQLLENKWLQY